ncbi:M23 family metallopeptidase [Thermodesulfobacteriota bacterium]
MRFTKFSKYITVIPLIMLFHVTAFSMENSVSLSSKEISQGGVIYIKILQKDNNIPVVEWMDREVSLLYQPDKKIYEGFIAADLEQKPGVYTLNILFKSSGTARQIPVKVLEKDYGVRRLTLPDNQVNLSKKDLDRAAREKKMMDQLWGASIPSPFWKSQFLMPLNSKIIGPFGRRSVINDQLRSPHTGLDLRGEKGTPVIASNNGKVVLTGNHFFTGNTVVIDHGAGIISMYFHLNKMNVIRGDNILKGDILGTVGSTGRVTGPHLHWGVRINGFRIDPVSLVELSNKLEE